MSGTASPSLYCPVCDLPFAEGTPRCPTDGTHLVRIADDPLLGREIDGRFELRQRVGAGGMGAVYRGWQRSVGRDVAVKVIRSHVHAEPEEVKRFMREAQLTSRLIHPNIVSVIDFGQTADGLLYLAMELLPGRPLSRVLTTAPEQRLAFERVVHIGVQLCDALQVAHEASIIHRDLKPSNIMVLDGPGDRVKVLDFGLARTLSGDHSTLTTSERVLGTPSYMSPEMAQGHDLDARSDLYSLGVVLYQLICGKLPHGGDSHAVLVSKLHREAPPLPADVPAVLANVIMRLLAPERERRYPSAATTREALLATRAWRPAPTGEPMRRSRARLWWLAAPLLAAAGVFALWPHPAKVEAIPVAAKPLMAPPSPAPIAASPAAPPAPIAASPAPVIAPVKAPKAKPHKRATPEGYIIPGSP